MKKNIFLLHAARRRRYAFAPLLLSAIILCGCGNSGNGKSLGKIDNAGTVKEDLAAETPPDARDGVLTATEHYSCTIGKKTVSFDAPIGYDAQDPVETSYVSNLSFYTLSLEGGASGVIDVIVTAPEYEQALSSPTERTAEEYLAALANRPDDFVGVEQTDTVASDVSFGDYSGYYATYLWDRYAKKGTHHITQTYSLFSGDTRVQVSLSISNTKDDLPDAPYITNIEIHDE